MENSVNCPTCGVPMKEYNRILLFVAGFVLFSLAVGLTQMGIWIYLSPFLGLAGLFVLIWTGFGKGLWCSTCKNIPLGSRPRK